MGKDFDKGSPNDANYESPKRESSEFPNEGCELSVGDKPCYAWWIFQLPYDKAGRYKKLEVGIYAKEKGWLGNGPTLYVYNWQQEEWDLVFTNKRTNGWSGWQEIDPTHGKYTHPQFDKVALLIYADGLDHIHVKYVAVQAQYADRPKAYVTADVGNKIQIGPEGRKITITVKNEGGPADYMYLTVSYSKNLKVVEKDSQERWKYYPPGSEVAGRTGKRETKYPMHEATVEHYGTGTKTYWLKFKKIDDGEGWIKYRVAMNSEGRIPNGIDPDTFSRYPTSGSEDQQGWYAVEIKVIEPSMIVVNDPLKFGKVHKGKYPQKDLEVYNFGSWGSLLDWEATPQDTWISIAPSSGTGVKRGKYDKVSVEIDTNRVSNPPGEIIFTATNIWNKPQQTVEINIEVVGPPTITCTVPTVAIVDEDVKLRA
ncbi:MAG TPA: hypothetical protein EYP10_02505, partial [Armatimonadetes bacterium]|nr:hypothetical protein [Armatimonadota bacterium]